MNTLKFIGDDLLILIGLVVFAILVTIVTVVTAIIIILTTLLGHLFGIGTDIFIYFTMFCISLKVWDVLEWVIGKIHNRIKRKNT